MDSHESFIKTHTELLEWRSELCKVNQSENKYKTVLRELNKLGLTISETLKDAETVTQNICNGANTYELENNTLRVGKASVNSLVAVKHTATEFFGDIKESDNEFKEILNCKPLYEELEMYERRLARNREFIKYLKLSLRGLHEAFNTKSKDEKVGLSDSETVSSTNATDPSTLGFSLFENSATNAATSSPLAHH